MGISLLIKKMLEFLTDNGEIYVKKIQNIKNLILLSWLVISYPICVKKRANYSLYTFSPKRERWKKNCCFISTSVLNMVAGMSYFPVWRKKYCNSWFTRLVGEIHATESCQGQKKWWEQMAKWEVHVWLLV